MSHFATLVITKTNRQEELQEKLAPFHEFECTGLDDQYVQDIDILEKTRKEYEEETCRRLVDPDGNLHYPYDNEFYRDPTPEEEAQWGPLPRGTGSGHGISWHSRDWGDGRGYRTKVRFIPEGWEEADVPYKDVMSFRDFCESWEDIPFIRPGEKPDLKGKHKYNYGVLDYQGGVVALIRRTNPNDKWDWWTVGGRYAGRFADKNQPGFRLDQVKISDIDWAAIRAWRQLDFEETWQEAQKRNDEGLREFLYGVKNNETQEEFVRRSLERGLLTAYAFIDEDGKWNERGEMGWWGFAANEKDKDEWDELVGQWIRSVCREYPDHYLTVVDCHI